MPISRSFTLFTILVMTVLGSVLFIVVSLRAGTALRESQEENIDRQMKGIISAFTSFIDARHMILRDYAAFPLMTQSVMQPEQNLGNIEDFMRTLALLGGKYQMVLLDFSGKTIHATRATPRFDYGAEPWLSGLLEGRIGRHTGISRDGEHYFCRIAVPVVYNGMVEGALLAEIPISEVGQAFAISGSLTNANLQLVQRDRVIASMGDSVTGPTRDERLEELDVVLRYRVDESGIVKVRMDLLVQIGLVLLIAMVAASLSSITMGRKLIVAPLEYLRMRAVSLSEEATTETIPQNFRIRELGQLATAFNTMAEKIQGREKSLRNSQEKLEETNRQLKENQAQLVQSEKMASIGQLAAGVAHEINNPMAFIKSNLGALKRYARDLSDLLNAYETLEERMARGDADELREARETIRRNKEEMDLEYVLRDMNILIDESSEGAERVNEIVRGLRGFSHVDKPGKVPANLNVGLASTLKIVWSELNYKATVQTEYGDIPQVRCHPMELNQVFVNLLVNAAQAIETQGTITIRTFCSDGHVCVQVADTGAGMTPEVQRRVFEPFFTTKEVGKGTGLGLSMAHNIVVKRHGGEILVDSEVGVGTTFTVKIPLAHLDE